MLTSHHAQSGREVAPLFVGVQRGQETALRDNTTGGRIQIRRPDGHVSVCELCVKYPSDFRTTNGSIDRLS
jgi:hypothetical protein